MNAIERGTLERADAARVANPELPVAPGADAVLTVQESVFVHWYVDTRNVMQAYRQAYSPALTAKANTCYAAACNVLKRPHVMRAVREAQDAINAQTIVKAVDMLQDLYDIATADPNELAKSMALACRHCHGVDHQEQWRDAAELARAMDAYLTQPETPAKNKRRLPMPDAAGGFGYDPRREPAGDCPTCFGDGIPHSRPPDTTRLTPKARKLYKGLRFNVDGSLKEVLMHDQMQARDMIIKMLGAYKTDGKGLQGSSEAAAAPISATATAIEAQAAYMKLVNS